MTSSPRPLAASPWPAADALFRSDPRWRGSDDAYSIPLGDGRTLWLFGDTFIARRPGVLRPECAFIRNSIGIQEGYDPSTAAMEFYWRGSDAKPGDFFAADRGWLWPLHGALLDGRLLLFFMRVQSPAEARGAGVEEWAESDSLSFFDVYGWDAIVVANPHDHPLQWRIEPVESSPNQLGVILGAGVLVEGDWLYGWGWTAERNGYLVKWSAEDAASGRLRNVQWWVGDGRWDGEPRPDAVALTQAQTEFTIHRDATSGRLVQVQAMGLSPSDLTIRWASAPDAPWTEPQPVYRIPESERSDVIAYAGKGHPHLHGADLVLTYASNGTTAERTFEDESIYYPRVVRLDLSR